MILQDHSRYRFFNGTNGILNFEYDSINHVWTGSIHFNEVSTGLFETVALAILEEIQDTDGNIRYVKPIANSGEGIKLTGKLVTNKYTSDGIFLFETVLSNGDLEVSKITSKELELDNSTIADHSNPAFKTILNNININEEALVFNLGLHSEEDKSHLRWLEISSSAGRIAYIKLYGETVGEDDRLGILLDNLGMSVDESDMFVFKEHDVKEQATDWILLNAKRKEMLLEGHNIKPYIGTYKALLNAIKFYGYNSLTLKEYWLDINKNSQNFGKLKAVPVTDVDSPTHSYNSDNSINKPTGTAKKTSRFSLTYRINRPTGEYDEWDLPQVEEVFDFTPEEVLVKLYALKNKLQRDYLPLYAKIIDITGEADIFGIKNINVTSNMNPVVFGDFGVDAKYSVYPDKTLYIENLEKISPIFVNSYNDFINFIDNSLIVNNQLYDQNDVMSHIVDFYTDYYNLNLEDKELTPFDNDGPIAGAPLILKCEAFEDSWDSLGDLTWNDFNVDIFNTWNDFWIKNAHEIEWQIKGPNGFDLLIRGSLGYWSEIASSTPSSLQALWIPRYSQIPLVLPYTGSYEVQMRIYDLHNYVSQIVDYDRINVESKNVCIYGMYKFREENYTWNDTDYDWREASSSWNLPVNNTTRIQDVPATAYLTLDRSNYSYNNPNPDMSTIIRYLDNESETGWSETSGPYFWDNMSDCVWNDTKNLWWESTEIGPDQSSSFKISDIANGSILTIYHKIPESNLILPGSHVIGSSTPTGINDVAGWQAVCDELNTSLDILVSKFNYNPVFLDTDNDGVNDTFLYILAVGKEYSAHYDFEEVILTNGSVHRGQHYVSRNPTWNDTIFFESHATVSKLTHVTFSLDKTMMPGKTKPKWTLKNLTKNSPDIYYDNMWFTYLFKEAGSYSLSLELEDSNGNKNSITKNIITVK